LRVAYLSLSAFIPASIRWAIAAFSAAVSKEMTIENGDALSKNVFFALTKFGEDYDAVILGHSHRPVLRQRIVAERKKTFVALGDWIRHFHFFTMKTTNFFLAITGRGN